jgi:hypothetical protein
MLETIHQRSESAFGMVKAKYLTKRITLRLALDLFRTRRRNTQLMDTRLEAHALEYVKHGPILVEDLYHELKKESSTLDVADVTELVWGLVEQGRIELRDMPLGAVSLVHYLGVWEENLWFYVAFATSILALLFVYLIPANSPLVALRWVLGTALAVFIPGYVILKALFPGGLNDLDAFIRFGLSVGLSLTIAMLIGLFLSFTPWGIRFTPILLSMTGLTIGLTLFALWRQFARAVGQSRSD